MAATRPKIITRTDSGQSLVEFSLVIPIFLLLLIGLIEFAFMFNSTLAINFITRDASLIAAEAGNQSSADCTILRKVEEDVTPPLDNTDIQTVTIFQADRFGQPMPGIQNVYQRTGTTTCPFGTLPYALVGAATFPASARCNDLEGCLNDQTGQTVPLDTIGVSVTYRYFYHTPLPNLIPFLPGSARGWLDFTWSNVMRMEPVL